ncbi:MAG: gliding motility-associated C-terminal domain-containing protein [Cryomorphaceae bacterium]|nr:gliding motility-associated C-terminal domain-containing protein [Cryomorphaceae bacterium]
MGNLIRICTGSSVTLNPGANAGASYNWNTGATSQTINVSQTGTYWVTITNNCGSITDTVEVIVDQPIQPNFGGTLGLCPQNNDTLVFTLPPGTSYIWSTGHMGQTLSVTQPGTYWGQYTNACGTFSDNFEVIWSAVPIFSLGPDTAICSSSGFSLSVPNNLGNVVWSTGSQANQINITSTGMYSATVTNNCGSYTDSVFITVIPTPVPMLDDTIGKCETSNLNLTMFSSMPANTTINWSNGTSGNTTSYTTSGSQYAIVQGPCINDTISFYIDEVSPLPPIDLGDTIVSCDGVTLDVGAQSPSTQITWSTGSFSPEVTINSMNFVYVTLTNACGSVSDSVMIYTLMPPDSSALSDTIMLCPDQLPYILEWPQQLDSLSFLWSTGDTTYYTEITDIGQVSVTMSNRCGFIEKFIYIDTFPPVQPFQLPADTTFCEGEVFNIDGRDTAIDDNNLIFFWRRNGEMFSSFSQVNITESGFYELVKTNSCDTLVDEMNVVVLPTPKVVMPDTIFVCVGDTAWLEPDTNGTFFQWSNGYNALVQPVTQAGTYSVVVANSCDTITDEVVVVVEQLFPFYSTIDTVAICEGSVLIQAPIPGARYLWSNGSSRSSLRVHQTGKYWVKIMNACDTVVDTTTVLITGPPQSQLGTFVDICQGNALILDAQNFGSTYLWSTGDTTRRISVEQEGMYYVDIENPCGFFRDSIQVFVVEPVRRDLGNDTILCEGDTFQLDAGNERGRASFAWSTGDTTQVISVTETGKYYVTISNACGFRVDTVNVTFLGVPEFSLDSVFRCVSMTSIKVSGPLGNDLTYLWSTGDTKREIDVGDIGMYWLTVDNGCFTYTDTFWLVEEYPLDIFIGNDTTLCEGESLTLSVQHVPQRLNVRWNTGHVGRTLTVNKPGNYVALVRNTCGEFYDTVRVRYDEPLSPDPIERLFCWGNTYRYNLNLKRYQRSVVWFDGDTSMIRDFNKGGAYDYQLTNACGTFFQRLELQEENCDCPFYVPNAFTPDGDGINDVFKYGFDCNILRFEIRIFSRWGNMVFYNNNEQVYWDGTNNGGAILPTGSYTYVINIIYSKYGQPTAKDLQGVVNIIR